MSVTSRSSGGFEDHAVALAFKCMDAAAGCTPGVAPVVVGRARVVVGRLVGEQAVGRGEHGVGDGHDRFLVTAMLHDAPVARGESPLSRARARG